MTVVLELEERFRVVTTFHPFMSWDHGRQKYVELTGHQNISLEFETVTDAEASARGMRRLHPHTIEDVPDGNTAVIETIYIQRRLLTPWKQQRRYYADILEEK